MVKMLLNYKADYLKCNNKGQSLLRYGSKYGRTEIVRILLDKGVDYNNCDKIGMSPLMYACEHCQTDIVKILLDISRLE